MGGRERDGECRTQVINDKYFTNSSTFDKIDPNKEY